MRVTVEVPARSIHAWKPLPAPCFRRERLNPGNPRGLTSANFSFPLTSPGLPIPPEEVKPSKSAGSVDPGLTSPDPERGLRDFREKLNLRRYWESRIPSWRLPFTGSRSAGCRIFGRELQLRS
jgi:hypothetical protein